ncbi:hypothetical protein N836_04480 [Leptolyngbya sp. Heron Island J]|nr:hypothetical protein N836_04480 [Leptolyngbya sp. Heron Island J]
MVSRLPLSKKQRLLASANSKKSGCWQGQKNFSDITFLSLGIFLVLKTC